MKPGFLTRQGTNAMLCMACLASALTIAATPAELLLAELSGEFTRPQLRCEWAGARVGELPLRLSLQRETVTGFSVLLDGRPIADTRSGSLSLLELEIRLFGPTTAIATGTTALLGEARSIATGRQLEISFTDQTGRSHPVFCGTTITSMVDPRTGRVEIGAVQPRVSEEVVHNRQFTDMRRVEALMSVSNERGLQTIVHDLHERPVLQSITQNNQSDWRFLRNLAAADGMDLTLSDSADLLLRNSSFVPPASSTRRRNWVDMSWLDIVRSVARENGLVPVFEETLSYPPISIVQVEEDLIFLANLATKYGRSAYLSGNRLRIVADDVWRPNPALRSITHTNLGPTDLAQRIANDLGLTLNWNAAPRAAKTYKQHEQTDNEFMLSVLAANGMRLERDQAGLLLIDLAAPGAATDLLLSRIRILAGGRRPAISRAFGDGAAQLLDPMAIPSTTLTLNLGGAAATHQTPQIRFLPTDVTGTAVDLEAALSRVRAAARGNPRESFLAEGAQNHRPTLLFRYATDSHARAGLATLATGNVH